MEFDKNINVGDIVQITCSLGCVPFLLDHKSYCKVIEINYRGQSDYILVKTLNGLDITQFIYKEHVTKVNLSEDELLKYRSKAEEYSKYILHQFGVY